MSSRLADSLCELARSFFARGLAFGSTGNLSVRDNAVIWITPTGVSFRDLQPEQLALISEAGEERNVCRPSKEFPFHLGCYRAAGARAQAVVHLHAPHSVALSCLEDLSAGEPLPVFTPYYLMRVAPLAIVPYFRPGSPQLAAAVEAAARDHDVLLLRNHGSIALGRTLEEAADRAEELEETAKLYFLLRGERIRYLTAAERAEIEQAFPCR